MDLAAEILERKIRCLRPDTVQCAHRRIVGICRTHGLGYAFRLRKPLYIRKIELFIAQRGIRVIEIFFRELGNRLEDIGRSIALLASLGGGKKPGHGLAGLTQGSTPQNSGVQSELLLHVILQNAFYMQRITFSGQ